jgi:hypothetical protein
MSGAYAGGGMVPAAAAAATTTINIAEVSSNLGHGMRTSTSKMRWAMANALSKESCAQLQIGPTLEAVRGENRDPAPITLN